MKTRNTNHLVTLDTLFSEETSCFESVKSIDSFPIKISDWLRHCINPIGQKITEAKNKVLEYRRTNNKSLKIGLPAFCPGALLKSRDRHLSMQEKIIYQTGWMQFDIDLKDNPNLPDASVLRDQISKIKYVAFASLSVSGKGVWGLVKVSSIDEYKNHFRQLTIDFKHRGILLDTSKGGNPTDLRIYSYDPNAYIADEIVPYNRKNEPVRKRSSCFKKDTVEVGQSTNELVKMITLKSVDIAPDYESYLRLGFAFANEFGESGRELFHRVCRESNKYDENHAEKLFSDCVKSNDGRTTIATFFHLCKEAGIKLS